MIKAKKLCFTLLAAACLPALASLSGCGGCGPLFGGTQGTSAAAESAPDAGQSGEGASGVIDELIDSAKEKLEEVLPDSILPGESSSSSGPQAESADELLDEVVNNSAPVIEVLTEFSFGLLEGECVREGHTVTYVLRCKRELGPMEKLTASGFEGAVNLVSDTISGSLDNLKQNGVTDAVIEVEFRSRDGEVLYSRTFS